GGAARDRGAEPAAPGLARLGRRARLARILGHGHGTRARLEAGARRHDDRGERGARFRAGAAGRAGGAGHPGGGGAPLPSGLGGAVQRARGGGAGDRGGAAGARVAPLSSAATACDRAARVRAAFLAAANRFAGPLVGAAFLAAAERLAG